MRPLTKLPSILIPLTKETPHVRGAVPFKGNIIKKNHAQVNYTTPLSKRFVKLLSLRIKFVVFFSGVTDSADRRFESILRTTPANVSYRFRYLLLNNDSYCNEMERLYKRQHYCISANTISYKVTKETLFLYISTGNIYI
jgi:hypothetical protein